MELESPSYTKCSWNGLGVTATAIAGGTHPVYFAPIVADLKITGGRWVYEVDIRKYSLRHRRSGTSRRAANKNADTQHLEPEEFIAELSGSSASEDDEEAGVPDSAVDTGTLIAQIGFVTMGFYSCQVDLYGVGDDRNSWGYDGCRRLFFHGGLVRRRGAPGQVHRIRYANEKRWGVGDTVGVAISVTPKDTQLEYFLNGQSLGVPNCIINSKYHPGGFYPALSRSRGGAHAQFVFRFGSDSSGGPFKYSYPGFEAIGMAPIQHFRQSLSNKDDFALNSPTSHRSIHVAPLVPHFSQYHTQSFAVSVASTAEDINFVSWDDNNVRAKVQFVQKSKHPTWTLFYGYNSRQYTRIIRYQKWDSTRWSARIVFDSKTGSHTLCHWPAGEQDKKEFELESLFSIALDSDDEFGNVPSSDEGEDAEQVQVRKKDGLVERLSDTSEDLVLDVSAPDYIAPPKSYLDVALTFRGPNNTRCSASPVDHALLPTKGFGKHS